jgi:hypothetical protein
MTHSNHRRGSRESLMGDWVIFTYPGKTTEHSRKILDIYTKYNPVGCSCSAMENGKRTPKRYIKGWDKKQDSGVHKSVSLAEMRELNEPGGWVAGVYDNKVSVQGVISELGEGDFGSCTVVSGIFDDTFDALKKSDVAYPHTINMSAETFGKLELLPEPKILEIITMCGHHFVSRHLVKHMINEVKKGRRTAKEAAVELGKQCTCNFFNAARAEKLINEYIKTEQA